MYNINDIVNLTSRQDENMPFDGAEYYTARIVEKHQGLYDIEIVDPNYFINGKPQGPIHFTDVPDTWLELH